MRRWKDLQEVRACSRGAGGTSQAAGRAGAKAPRQDAARRYGDSGSSRGRSSRRAGHKVGNKVGEKGSFINSVFNFLNVFRSQIVE